MTRTLRADEARRIALAAQGFARTKGKAPTARAILGGVARLGLLQIDSVNVLARAHYLPLFSRLGAYERAALDRLAGHDGGKLKPERRSLFEYWGHEASLLPVATQPLLRWRMARAREGLGVWRGIKELALANPGLVTRLLDEIRDRGPLSAGDLTSPERGKGGWWGWSDSKTALEWLFWTGQVTAAGRRGFERIYDLPERVLPSAILAMPTPDPHDAATKLAAIAARALGVATAFDLRDYWRLPVEPARVATERLVEMGTLVPVRVQGWRQQAYLAADAVLPRRIGARALIVPFDPLIFCRERTERLFGFRYRIEIYTPADKRQHGYYVLPFLLGDRLVARVDLKAERAEGCLLVRGAHLEPGIDEGLAADALALELHRLADWLGLQRVRIGFGGMFQQALAERVQAAE